MRVLACVVATTMVLAAPHLAAQSLDLKELRQYFKTIDGGPYTYLETPRYGMGVGTIYLIQDRTTFYYSRPEECFAPEALSLSMSNMKPRTVNLSGKYSVELGMKIASGGLGGAITEEAKAELKKSGITGVEISIPSLVHQGLTIKQLQSIVSRQMDQECKASLSKKPERWLILETLSASDYTVTLKKDSSTGGGISAGLFKFFFPSFKGDSQKAAQGTLEFKNQAPPYLVAMKAIKLKDATQFSGKDSEVFTVTPDSYYQIVDRR